MLIIFLTADINYNASPIRYEVLDTLEFTSDRKRMSVVVRDCQSGEISLLSKGADETILPLTCSGNLIFISMGTISVSMAIVDCWGKLCVAWSMNSSLRSSEIMLRI